MSSNKTEQTKTALQAPVCPPDLMAIGLPPNESVIDLLDGTPPPGFWSFLSIASQSTDKFWSIQAAKTICDLGASITPAAALEALKKQGLHPDTAESTVSAMASTGIFARAEREQLKATMKEAEELAKVTEASRPAQKSPRL